ncbi:MAG: hypothetical protein IJK23_05605 [Clostridia bacterium]|nr:hypothetical protein [Clostridia bacterium]
MSEIRPRADVRRIYLNNVSPSTIETAYGVYEEAWHEIAALHTNAKDQIDTKWEWLCSLACVYEAGRQAGVHQERIARRRAAQ